MNTFLARTAVISFFLLATAAGHAQNYSYQKINFAPQFLTFALDISDDGRVVGWATDYASQVNGFIEQNGNTLKVPVKGASYVQLTAIQGSTLYGVASGGSFGDGSGFSMDAKGNVTLLRLASNIAALPSGVNAKGTVVGTYKSQTVDQGAFILQNGVYKTYSVPGSYDTTFSAINNQGVIVGTWNKQGAKLMSFKLVNGQLSPIAFPGSYSTLATGINDAGEIVGTYYKTADGPLGLFRYNGTAYTNIPVPVNAYACNSGHINNASEFVGSCTDSTSYVTYGFVATPR